MTKSLLSLSLIVIYAFSASGQDAQNRATIDTNSETSTSAKTNNIMLENGTRLSAELQKVLDVRKAKVGDEVVLKTTQAIRSDGRVVVEKGARLLGLVTEVATKSTGSPSRIALRFDRLEQGPLTMPITISIRSISHTSASAGLQNDDGFSGAGVSSSRSSSSNSPATLVGVGGVISSTTSVLGSTVNSTTNVAGAATSGLEGSLGAIQISQASTTSLRGESVLSLPGGNLRLEKGTRFNLVVSQSAHAATSHEE